MGIGNTNTAGGALNFKVVGGTTEPTNPKENMIWVNTDTSITGWGIGDYQYKPGWSMPEGFVYIDADTSANSGGDFNALKNNEIWLKPIHAIQRVNGTWMYKDAGLYKSGAWIDLPIKHYFYNRGDIAESGDFADNVDVSTGVVSYNSDHIYIKGTMQNRIFFRSYRTVPLEYKKMVIVGEVVSNSDGVCFQWSGLANNSWELTVGWDQGEIGHFTKTIDISHITTLSDRYVKIAVAPNANCVGKIYEIYFTR